MRRCRGSFLSTDSTDPLLMEASGCLPVSSFCPLEIHPRHEKLLLFIIIFGFENYRFTNLCANQLLSSSKLVPRRPNNLPIYLAVVL